MWLLDARTWQLQYFEESRLPKYAILSHRWEEGEVSFKEMDERGHEVRKASYKEKDQKKLKRGYRKIAFCCDQALVHNLLYVWVDTCCIDQSSSAELSEAINSMYRWYKLASRCYAFLGDVYPQGSASTGLFSASQWFTRGWTLQELLAPTSLDFYDHHWTKIGSRTSLHVSITAVTGIPAKALLDFYPRNYSVADRMSWAANRQTARVEDIAYSLFGIFEINMPLIYGEGQRAFHRLQDEILKVSMDLSLFAWQDGSGTAGNCGPLASSPSAFDRPHQSLTTVDFTDRDFVDVGRAMPTSESFQGPLVSAAGVSLTLFLVPFTQDTYLAPLAFLDERPEKPSRNSAILPENPMSMLIQRWDIDGHFRRIHFAGKWVYPTPSDWIKIGQFRRVVVASCYACEEPIEYQPYGMRVASILNDPITFGHVRICSRAPQVDCEPNNVGTMMQMAAGDSGVAGVIYMTSPESSLLMLHFGYDFDFNPFCLVTRPTRNRALPDQSMDPLYNTKVSVMRLQLKDVPVASSEKIMGLVSAMRDERWTDFSLDYDGVELHIAPWKFKDARFVISGIGTIRFQKDRGSAAGPSWPVSVFIDVNDPTAAGRGRNPMFDRNVNDTWYSVAWVRRDHSPTCGGSKKRSKPPMRQPRRSDREDVPPPSEY